MRTQLSFFSLSKALSFACFILLTLIYAENTSGQSQVFVTNGNFTVPGGVTSITVYASGGGGGGSRSNGGGGGGAYASSVLTVVPGSVIPVTVGSAGNGGGSPTNGGNSIFGANLVVAAGGRGATVSGTGGLGGSTASSTGTTKFAGGKGGNSGGNSGGGGGGSAFNISAGGLGGNGVGNTGGIGGIGTGPGGAGGSGSGGNGVAGTAPGGGGGAGGSSGSSANGAVGRVQITWTACVTLSLNFTPSQALCPSCPTGSIALSVLNGSPNYTYSWVGPNGYSSTSEDPSSLLPGSYSVTVTDANGCQGTGSTTVNAQVTQENTTISCQGYIPLTNDPGLCSATTTVSLLSPTSGDPSVQSVFNSFSGAGYDASGTFPVGNTTILWMVTYLDNSTATCLSVVGVADNQPPSLLCPGTQVLSAIPNPTNATFTSEASFQAAIAGFSTAVEDYNNFVYGAAPFAGAPLSYMMTGSNGVTTTYSAINGVYANTGEISTNSATAPLNVTFSGQDVYAIGGWFTATNIVGDFINATVTLSDGNTINHTFTPLNHMDFLGFTSQVPIVSFVVGVAAGWPTIDHFYTASASGCGIALPAYTPASLTDNCGTPSYTQSPPAGTFVPLGITAVTLTAVDGSFLSSFCSFNVDVVDNSAPNLVCHADIVTCAQFGGPAQIFDIQPTAYDFCGIDYITYYITGASSGSGSSDASGTYFEIGTSTVTYTAYDVNGNSSTCSFQVEVLLASFDCDFNGHCPNDAPFALTGGSPAGGTYSGLGVSGGMFDPSLANPGYNTITYTVNIGESCQATVQCDILIYDAVKQVVNVGANVGDDYPTLTGATGLFAAINAKGLCGDVVANITTNITEPGIIALNQWFEYGVGAYSLTIKPADPVEKVLTGNFPLALIRINGADRVNILGQLSPTDPNRRLRFRNASTTAPVMSFTNGATNEQVSYCTIEGKNTTTTSGLLVLGTTTSVGNSFIQIDNNLFRQSDGLPTNHILSSGTATAPNHDVSILGNTFTNFTQNGIYVTGTGNGSNWNIDNNQFYWDFTGPATLAQTVINFIPGTASVNNNITLNTIGGANVMHTGYWINSGAITFKGIAVSAGASFLGGNIVKGISLSNTGATNFIGIDMMNGLTTIGTHTSPNIIGDSLTASSITMAGLVNFFGIRSVSTNSNSVVNSNIVANASSSIAAGYPNMYGIYVRTGTVSHNRIFKVGSLSTTAYPVVFGIMNLGFSNFMTDVFNNMVSLDGGSSSNPKVFGIQDNAYSATAIIPSGRYAHNSVEVYGGATAFNKTFAFQRNYNGIVDVRNNIFYNSRPASPVGHYAVSSANMLNWTADYNDLFVASANLGFWGASNQATLALWKIATSQDANSINIAPVFVASPANLHLSTLAASNAFLNNVCVPLAWVTDDIDVESRSVLVDFGADEFSIGPRIAPEVNNMTASLQAYPNPFESSVQLSVSVSQDSKINLVVYNMLGDKVADVAEENLMAGTFDYSFNAAGLPAGVYLCRMTVKSGDKTEMIVKRIVKNK